MLSRGRLNQDALRLRRRIAEHHRRTHADSRQLTADLRDALRSPLALPVAFALGLLVPKLHPWSLIRQATRLSARVLAAFRLYRLFRQGFATAMEHARQQS
jgi:hypothetical protein